MSCEGWLGDQCGAFEPGDWRGDHGWRCRWSCRGRRTVEDAAGRSARGEGSGS